MRSNPCAGCPFREGSKTVYDRDAIEALDEGQEPSCHCVVGHHSIFDAVLPERSIACLGYLSWQEGEPGFCRPKLNSDMLP